MCVCTYTSDKENVSAGGVGLMDADELSKEHAWSDIDDCLRRRYRQADSLSNPFKET